MPVERIVESWPKLCCRNIASLLRLRLVPFDATKLNQETLSPSVHPAFLMRSSGVQAPRKRVGSMSRKHLGALAIADVGRTHCYWDGI